MIVIKKKKSVEPFLMKKRFMLVHADIKQHTLKVLYQNTFLGPLDMHVTVSLVLVQWHFEIVRKYSKMPHGH